LDGLLEAYALYRARTTTRPWSLVIAGGGDEEGRLRGLEGALELEGVHWAGFLQYHELPLYYGLAGAFVHPAKSEPWGLVVNEAAASGLPLLVSNTVGAGHELVRSRENGFRFNPNDVGDMREALLKLTGLPQEQIRVLGKRSLEVSHDWTPRRFGDGLFDAVEAATAVARA
jgi:glycosyltransferase involved in cell wall biosynthesis